MTPIQEHYVYRHIRPDKNEPFYVGLGKGKRSISNTGRNKYWKNIVAINKGEYLVEIMLDNLSKEEARKKEEEFIALYGRYKHGGTLCNILKGGQLQDIGYHSGKTFSEETKRKMSNSHKGNKSTTGMMYITDGSIYRMIYKTENVPAGWKKEAPRGYKLSEAFRENISNKLKGRKKNLTEEQIKERSAKSKGNTSAKGFMWINDGSKSTLIKNTESIPEGYNKGRIRTWINQYNK